MIPHLTTLLRYIYRAADAPPPTREAAARLAAAAHALHSAEAARDADSVSAGAPASSSSHAPPSPALDGRCPRSDCPTPLGVAGPSPPPSPRLGGLWRAGGGGAGWFGAARLGYPHCRVAAEPVVAQRLTADFVRLLRALRPRRRDLVSAVAADAAADGAAPPEEANALLRLLIAHAAAALEAVRAPPSGAGQLGRRRVG